MKDLQSSFHFSSMVNPNKIPNKSIEISIYLLVRFLKNRPNHQFCLWCFLPILERLSSLLQVESPEEMVLTGTMEWIMTFPSHWEFHHPNWLIFFRGVGWNHRPVEIWVIKWLWNVSWTPSIRWWCTDICTYICKDACNVKSEYVFEILGSYHLPISWFEILPVLHPKRSDEGPGIDKWRTTCITGVKPTTNRNKFQ